MGDLTELAYNIAYNHGYDDAKSQDQTELDRLRDRVAKLTEALEWYAGPAWEAQPSTAPIGGQQIWTPIDRDYGKRAREALKE